MIDTLQNFFLVVQSFTIFIMARNQKYRDGLMTDLVRLNVESYRHLLERIKHLEDRRG